MNQDKVNLALVYIAKNEDRYLREAIDWHKQIGFDSIFVYENNWRFDGDRTQLPNTKFIPFDGEVMQLKAYNNWIETYSEDYDWAAFIDVDEFIVPRNGANFKQWLKAHDWAPIIALNWRLMGDNGLSGKEQTTWSVLERFTKGARDLNQHVKCLINLKLFRESSKAMPVFLNPHFTTHPSWSPTAQCFFTGPWQDKNLDKEQDIELWHYAVKTKEELHEKVMRGRADTLQTRQAEEEQYFKDHNCNDIDLSDALKDVLYKEDCL